MEQILRIPRMKEKPTIIAINNKSSNNANNAVLSNERCLIFLANILQEKLRFILNVIQRGTQFIY